MFLLILQISRVDVYDYECLGIANVFKNLVMMFPSVCITSLPTEVYNKFIANLKTLTCAFGRAAALEEEVCTDIANF